MKTSKKKFWEILKGSKSFYVSNDARIRRSREDSNYEICPVCHVANRLLKKRLFNENHEDAAERIGLDLNFADQIALASDYDDPPNKIRNKLSKMLNLNLE